MTASMSGRRIGTDLALAGAGLGVVAGLVQATVGSRIPAWSGAKSSPGSLGLLTIALSALAGLAAMTVQRNDQLLAARPVGDRPRDRQAAGQDGYQFEGQTAGRLIAATFIVVTALLCFTTVGRLWYVPGVLLLVGGVMTVDSWKTASGVIRSHWLRILLAALGGCELLMAASASPLRLSVGAVGGVALIAAAWTAGEHRAVAATLIVLGTVPFAAVAWTAIVPLLVLVVAAGLAIPVLRTAGPHRPA